MGKSTVSQGAEGVESPKKLSITDVYWQKEDDNTKYRDFLPEYPVNLYVETKDYEENDFVSLSFKDKNGKLFKGGKEQLKVSGRVDGNGIMCKEGFCAEYQKVEVKRIKLNITETSLDEGSSNDGSGGIQYGMIYGKEYNFEVKEFLGGIEPEDDNDIKWEFSYVGNDGIVVIGAFKTKGRKATLKIDDLNMLGTTITIRAYINERKRSQNEKIWVHHRFRWIDRSKLVSEINQRKANPKLIDQGTTSLCGVASIGYILAKINFADYKSYVEDMHCYGIAKIKTTGYKIEIDNDEHLLEYKSADTKYPKKSDWKTSMDGADFIFLTTIKDNSNIVFDYDPDGTEAGSFSEGGTGISFPNDIHFMMKKILNFDNVADDTNLITSKWGFTTNLLKDIQKQLSRGYYLIILNEANSFIYKTHTRLSYPTHWIVLLDLTFDESKEEITYKIFSWGNETEVIANSFDLFRDSYYGYVKGKNNKV